MTWHICADCGKQLLTREAIVSRQSGRAWCANETACRERQGYPPVPEPTDRQIYATVTPEAER